ncbi:MAG: pentapeptide repeat-containing protein [Candidatus Zixiibacteriota bacterium]|nr:MAG: pentapeptide repeat-containing protein [candidate division Zixibacteria bacterium]
MNATKLLFAAFVILLLSTMPCSATTETEEWFWFNKDGVKHTEAELNAILENHLEFLKEVTFDYDGQSQTISYFDDQKRAHLNASNLVRAFLLLRNLTFVDFSDANLSEAILINANLNSAVFVNTNLMHARLENADLTFAVFNSSNLANVN